MATAKQKAANRRNAQHSTGPKSPAGKSKSSQNALKHGLLARDVVLETEDKQPFLDLLAAYEAESNPIGPIEHFLVRRLATLDWRLSRASRLDYTFMCRLIDFGWTPRTSADPPLTEETNHREITRALGAGLARFDEGYRGINVLTRYENTLRRAWYKTRDELRDWQARRASANEPPPQPQNENLPNEPDSPKPQSPEPLASKAEPTTNHKPPNTPINMVYTPPHLHIERFYATLNP